MSLTFSKYRDETTLTVKVIKRTAKLFVIGLLIQGGNAFSVGYDMQHLRIPGTVIGFALNNDLSGVRGVHVLGHQCWVDVKPTLP
jgi:predicted acyltransferase